MADLHDAAEIKRHVRIYMIVFGALGVLTVVTVGVGYLHMPFAPALIAALLIASVKAGLVAAYFMHLITEKKIILWTLVLTFVFLLFMFGLFVLAYQDQEGIFGSI